MTSQGLYIPWEDRCAKLDDLGYLPILDGWELGPGAEKIADYLYYLDGYAQPLWQYLTDRQARYLYTGWREV
jgi:hypothetical protein